MLLFPGPVRDLQVLQVYKDAEAENAVPDASAALPVSFPDSGGSEARGTQDAWVAVESGKLGSGVRAKL